MNVWIWFLLLTLFCVFAEGFFSMFEMACVSFNKARLQYYVSENVKRAKWLNHLLNKPSRFFGTTLITVNVFLQIGSESARHFYEALGLNPDFAPISQIFLVVIFGELAPMFAARRYPEHVAMLYIPVVYVVSKLLAPFIWAIDGISQFVHFITKKPRYISLFLSKEEVQRAFEERARRIGKEEQIDVNLVMGNFFTLKDRIAKEMMQPLTSTQMIPSNASLEEMRHVLSVSYSPFIPIYHKANHNIVAIAYPRDLLRVAEDQKVVDHSRPPWFITEDTSILQILGQFKTNNQSIAVVLDASGQAVGILTLDQIIDEIFGQSPDIFLPEKEEQGPFVERTLDGEMLLSDFNYQFQAELEMGEAETVSDLINAVLKHHPSKGESVQIDRFEFTILEPALFGAKTVLVRTL